MIYKSKSFLLLNILFVFLWLKAYSQQYGKPLTFNDNENNLALQKLSTNDGASDFPSICRISENEGYAVWQAYQYDLNKDFLYYAYFKEDKWKQPIQVPSVEGDLFQPVCNVDIDGNLVVVWMAQVSKDWDFWSTSFDGERWTEPEQIFMREGNDLFAGRAGIKIITIYLFLNTKIINGVCQNKLQLFKRMTGCLI